jgi:hypothetical protein
VLVVASGLLFVAANRNSPAEAACLKPVISVSPRSAAPGEPVLITGKGWHEGCQDTVGCANGGPCPEDPGAAPRYGISLRFRQGTNTDNLGEIDADRDGRFAYTAAIPLWAHPGAGVVSADDVASGLMVAGGLGAGAAPVALDASGGGSASAAPVEPLPKTGLDFGPLLGLLLVAAAALTRRLAPR